MRLVPASIVLSIALPAMAAPSRSVTLARVEGKSPHASAAAVAAALGGRTVSVTVIDARTGADPAIVGAQQLKDNLLYEWKAASPVPDAIRAMAEETLKSWGVAVAADAPLRLILTVRKLYVDEVPQTFGSTYRGEVELKGHVFDPDGASSAARTARGTGKVSGPDRKAKYCNEALTLALEDSLAQVLAPVATGPTVPGVVVDAASPNALTPRAMLQELLRLKEAGVGDQVLLGYVRQRRLSSALTVDDILSWKLSGLPESVIQAAQEAK